MAILLLVDGILLGIFESSYALPVPFLLAAYLHFMMPTDFKRRRMLAMATFIIVAFSLIFGLSYLTAGFGGSGLALVKGSALVALNTMVTVLVVHAFFLNETKP